MSEASFESPYHTHRVPVFAANMVATSQPLAVQAGLRMLWAGGNAVDAALAAAITLVVVEPTGNGLGSDAFCILWDGKELHGLNASGRSPAAWTPSHFARYNRMPMRGWDSVTIPGAVSAWVTLSERFGRLPFADLFAPAIAYARNGFPVAPKIARQWESGAALLRDQPGFAEHFMQGGRAPKAGEIWKSENLATSLELIAATRGEAFYRGELAEKIAAFASQHDAPLTLDDMAAHDNDWCGTISQRFAGVDVHEIPPNGQGIATLMALGMLEHSRIGDFGPDSPEAMHLSIEAMKLALSDVSRHLADQSAMDIPASALLDKDYLASRARLIDTGKASEPTAGAPTAGGTVYLATGDADGMMVSFIQSNYGGFGSGVVVPGTGIALQNRGFGFTLEPGHPNQVAPNKRPFHTIIPGFVMKDGAPDMAFGLMGGPMQAQGHLQMVLRTALFGQDPQTASDAPRWRVISGRKVALEGAMDDSTADALAAMGHDVSRDPPDAPFAFGGAQLVRRHGTTYVAGSDHRKDGSAQGF
jgi:gamma-glutamyltranspeptidase/glutathione hydrolase